MPRYFFHFSTATELIPDDKGTMLSDLKRAHDHGLTLIQKVLPALQNEDLRQWRIEVSGEDDRERLTILFPARANAVAPSAPRHQLIW